MKELITLPIKKLKKAEWNYKTDGSEDQIIKLMNSIEYDNSAGVLAVRKVKDKFEVIDGNHRLEALKRLGWSEVQVENFGDLPKSKAIILSRRRNHIWFDDNLLDLATLLKEDVIPETSMDELKKILPDFEDIENLLNFNEFDWEAPIQKTKDDVKTINIAVSDEVYELWEKWKNKCSDIMGYDSDQASFEYAIVEALNIPNKEINMNKFKK
tara:strand:- start:50 stop:685 length:636 start_codon:yes stop_codon:yes gene_type:complete